MKYSTTFAAVIGSAVAQGAYHGGWPANASSSAQPSTTYACNPAHQYPEGVRCVSTAGSLTLLSPPATSSKTPVSDVYVTAIVTDYTTYCPSPTTFTHKQQTYTVTKATTLTLPCPGGCTVTKPVESFPPATTVTAIVSSFTTYCPSPTTFTHQESTYTVTSATTITVPCKGGCTVTTPVSAIPPKSKKPRPSKATPIGTGTSYPQKPTVVTAITTVCPTPTTIVHESSTYTVTKATTLTLPCSTGCTVTQKPTAVQQPTVVTAITTVCPTPTTIVHESSTYTVTKPTTLTLPCSTGCTVKPTASAPAPAPSGAAPSASAPGMPSSLAPVASRPAVSASSSSPVAYTGAAAPTAVPMAAAAVAAVGAFFL